MPAVKGVRLGGRKTLKAKDFFLEMEKEEVKKGIDIVSLFEYFGTALTRKGKSYTGHCPFHDDRNPSLSVDREKGLFNCFGCGEAGDVFDLVEKMKGCTFTESLEFLKEYSSTGSVKKGGKEKLPETGKAGEPGITLESVAEYYRKSLLKSIEPHNYLEKRKISDYGLYERLKVGYSDGSLLKRITEGQKERLKASGLITSLGREFLEGCVTVPLFDEKGRVVSFYGRAVDERRKVKHLYLPGPHRGLVNRKAAGVYREEIILTESIFDALSLMELGAVNVIPCYGVNGFTDELLKLLLDERVKTVVIAFDADTAGREGAERLKDKLTGEGFTVKVIEPPSVEGRGVKDWNEGIQKGLGKEEVTALLASSPEYRGEGKGEKEFSVEREGEKYLFTIGGVSYRVLGVKEMFVSSLRVNIRAENLNETDLSRAHGRVESGASGRAKYLDNVDLYSARSRNLFSSGASHVLNTESVRMEKDLIRIVEYLEEERDRKFLRAEEDIPELTEEEKKAGMDLLTDPDLFNRITKDTEVLGYVGESVNKLLIYLAASSRKLPDPISVIVVSQSSAGKSYLIDTVKKLIPPEDVVSVTSLSDQALNYLDEEALKNKFLVMGEAVHSETVEHQLREMLSSHELSRLVTMKDPKTGELKSRMVRKEVIVSAVMSSTNNDINPENASRSFVINTDESEEQTRAIHRMQRKKYSVERFREKEDLVPEIIKTHRAAQRLLEKRIIVNPFADVIDFPSGLMRSRRDHERFMDLISAVCFLRQFQKEEKRTEEGFVFMECDLDDYRTAYGIMIKILPSTLTNFPESAGRLYEEVRKVIKEKAKEEGLMPCEVSVTQREIREKTGMSQMFVKRNMRILSDYEYVFTAGSPGARNRKSYRLMADESVRLIDLSIIPTPEEIKRKMNL